MARFGWFLLSPALYAVALFIPCLRLTSAPPGSPNEFLNGGQCLVMGIFGLLLVIPFLAWCANPWLLYLWIRVAFGKPVDRYGAWGALVYAVLTLALVSGFLGYRPTYGAFLWLASIGVGAYGATREKRLRSVPPRPQEDARDAEEGRPSSEA